MNIELNKSTKWLRRYFSLLSVAAIAALVYILFFGDNSVIKKIEYQRIIDSLNVEVAMARDSMLYYKDLNSRLSTDRNVMEQVVRERHFMKRPNEDVFIVSESKNENKNKNK